MIFGDYAGDQVLASALGLPRPGIGELSAPGWLGAVRTVGSAITPVGPAFRTAERK